MFLIGAPMCTRFCSWQGLNDTKSDPEEVKREHAKAVVHLQFMCGLYKAQKDAGRYFLHEHPAGASSWSERCIQEVLAIDEV